MRNTASSGRRPPPHSRDSDADRSSGSRSPGTIGSGRIVGRACAIAIGRAARRARSRHGRIGISVIVMLGLVATPRRVGLHSSAAQRYTVPAASRHVSIGSRTALRRCVGSSHLHEEQPAEAVNK